MVLVHVRVADNVDELPRDEAADVGEHVGEEGVAGDVERYAKAHVRTALVHLARQLPVRDEELREHVARREGHLVRPLERAGVPGGQDDASVRRLRFDRLDHLGELVVALPRVVGVHGGVVGAKVAPLEPVHGAEVHLLSVREADGVEVPGRRKEGGINLY